MSIRLVDSYVAPFVAEHEYAYMQPAVTAAHTMLHEKSGQGNAFLGWLDLPRDYDKEEYARIKVAADKIRKSCDVFIVIGIGGSYLGARAVVEFLKSPLYNNLKKDGPDIYFSGCNISATNMRELLEICEGRDVCINVISKSGTTTEPAVAFRIFRELLEKKYGAEGAKDRIFVTTDRAKGTLKGFADKVGYETFVVPDDVGGRFSVLSAVGLLPIAVAGIHIDELMKGADDARVAFADPDMSKNDCYKYAALRNILYRQGKVTEILVGYEPFMQMFCEWWKQLFGESEGKDKKGIYPSSVIFSTDLHSLGQYVQDGMRNLFETVVSVRNTGVTQEIPNDPENIDGLNFLSGKDLNYVNDMAQQGTLFAHVDGGVPNILLELEDRSAHSLGYMIYFFEKACAISGYLLGVNPFDQPGVEAYKKNMFALLGKPGYEEQKAALDARIAAL
ncbi:MAG: glucose-6-phosphate isomerase [Ruminococcaceae bacterium]|nr:glucose-6-phosphate isomerase [Oscillospiraceae bacterium]